MEIELVSKPARDLLLELLKHVERDDYVSHTLHPELTDIYNNWLLELREINFIDFDNSGNVRILNKGYTYPERRKTHQREMMLTSFWLPILVSLVVSILITSIAVQ